MNLSRHRIALVGLGPRGTVHAEALLKLSDRYEVVGLCELREERLAEYCRAKELPSSLAFTDAETMLRETQPEVFCFVTPPHLRLSLVELGVAHGIRALAFEKPMATSLAEARAIVSLCREHGVRAVVSHQQKYLTSLVKMKEIVDSGELGETVLVTASCQAWLAQLGTHFVDYAMWINRFEPVEWVVGHVHGKELLGDSHPSPNYVMGQLGFANGVRAFVEFGKLSKSYRGHEPFWFDNRLTLFGTRGYAWGETNGRWGALVNGREIGGEGAGWHEQSTTRLQPLYFAELADWLDGACEDHSCSLDHAYHGYEVMEALCLSALDHRRIDLPLGEEEPADLLDRLARELPECPERTAA